MHVVSGIISLRFATAFALAFMSCALSAAEPPTAPILRIETGRHTGAIWGVATDAAGRYVATASQDKTVRVWDAATGKQLETLRPPVGDDQEGSLSAVAMSPDGKLIAVGGRTGYEWDKRCNIYVFQRAGGRLIRRIGELPDTIISLAWSFDGRSLAVGLAGKNGVRVFRTNDYSPAGEDRDYDGLTLGLDFDASGKLASGSDDGFVRLYELSTAGLKLLAKKTAPGGKQPRSVKFSPDGSRIAVVFFNSRHVDVLSVLTLDALYLPSTDAGTGTFGRVTWSADGQSLYAGGMVQNQGKFKIRRWSDAGRGPYDDLDAASDGILSIAALAQGGIVYGGHGPAWGRFDSSDKRTVLIAPPTADFRSLLQGFRVSSNASEVQFAYGAGGVTPVRFQIPQQALIDGADAVLIAPRTSASGLAISDWNNNWEPKLNGDRLPLKKLEMARSLAVAPDGQSFLLGTDWNIRSFSREGKERWAVSVPGIAWAVNISGDGKTAVAALADGTIRWYRYEDGKELLALFPHVDRKRWVMWTPSGYYAASPGAEDLIGWHLNRGRDQAADFFPASRFRAQFYRPDVIAKVLQAGSETEALRLANVEAGRKDQTARIEQVLPPVVDMLAPGNDSTFSSTSVTVTFSLRAPADAPITGIRVRVNGQPVTLPDTRNAQVKSEDDTRELSVPVPPQDSEIMIFAENKNGVSTPGLVRLAWRGTAPADKGEFVVKPKLYVLAVGVSEYALRDIRLGFAAKDAQDFAAALLKQKGLLYRDVELKLLTDAAATRDEIVDGFDWLRKQVTNRDIGMVFLAGHGVNDADGKYYFLPVNGDPEKLRRTGVAQSEINDVLKALPGKAVFFVDTCHAGNVLGTGRRGVVDASGVVNELASAENGVLVFSSSTGRQYSLENPKWGNGAFTKALVEGINGKADVNKTGRITHKMLDFYISERVKELTGNQQTPVTLVPNGVPDFPVALSP